MRYQIRHALVQYAADTILEDVNFEVHDHEKIAVVGRNGCGKTTLLKLIAGDIKMNNLDSDERCGITMAGKQEIGFLRQISFADGEVTVEDEIKKTFSKVFACEARMKEIEALLHENTEDKILYEYDHLQKQMEALRGYTWKTDMEIMFQQFGFPLEDLKRPIGSFSGEDVEKKMGQLSGGEKVRLALCKMFYTRPNLLILDEPTNHMDMIGKDALEQMLRDFNGTVLFVSHDRYFIRQIATGILEFGKDEVRQYQGGYEDYLEEKRKREAGIIRDISKKDVELSAGKAKSDEPTLEDVFDKKTYYNPGKIKSRLLKQLEKYEKQLSESEEKANELRLQLLDPALGTDYNKLMELQNQLDAQEHQQETLLERMMETETQLEELE